MSQEELIWSLDVANELSKLFPERREKVLRAGGLEDLGGQHMLFFYFLTHPRSTKIIGIEGDRTGRRGAVDIATFSRMAQAFLEES